MCFSATTSFVSSATLVALGSFALYKVKKPSHYCFASIPLFFAIQQAAEGFLWLSFSQPAFALYYAPAMYVYLYFAMIFWPIWMPVAVRLMEKNEDKLMQLSFCFLAGLMFATQLFFWLIKYGAQATIYDHHILYSLGLPEHFFFVGTVLYLIATVLPFFLSSHKKMWLFGATLTVSYVLSYYFFTQTLLSVWCFFAALLSLLIVCILT